MKKVGILFLSFILFSCAPKYYITSGCVDFSNLTKDGFFITESNSVNFDYKPIGSIYSYISSGVSKRNYTWINANYDDALIELKREAVSRGSNGIINLSYNITRDKSYNTLSVYLEGMAIKK